MRLIDADEYIEKLRDRIRIEPTWDHSGLRIAIFELHNMPTIDPVKHGKWVMQGAAYGCSLCGEGVIHPFHNYCPNCGARMDEVKE